jgi:hypothetical protein
MSAEALAPLVSLMWISSCETSRPLRVSLDVHGLVIDECEVREQGKRTVGVSQCPASRWALVVLEVALGLEVAG